MSLECTRFQGGFTLNRPGCPEAQGVRASDLGEGGYVSVMQGFDGDGCEVVDGFVGPAVVVSVDPFQGGDLDVVGLRHGTSYQEVVFTAVSVCSVTSILRRRSTAHVHSSVPSPQKAKTPRQNKTSPGGVVVPNGIKAAATRMPKPAG